MNIQNPMDKSMASTLKMLLADDSPTIHKIINITFANQDVMIIPAADGKEACDLLNREKVDIILADATLPEIDGYALCQIVKTDPHLSQIPVVLLARGHEEVDPEKIKQVKASACIIKPIEPLELISLVKKLLGLPVTQGSPDRKGGVLKGSDPLSDKQSGFRQATKLDETLFFGLPLSRDQKRKAEGGSESGDEWPKLLGEYMLARAEEIFRETLHKMLPILTSEIVRSIEVITRDLVPDLAEKIIKEEIEKIKRGDFSA